MTNHMIKTALTPRRATVLLIILLTLTHCANQSNDKGVILDNVVFSSDFLGGKLDHISKKENGYIAYIQPAHEPVNKSPYYAFSVASSSTKEIELTLNYGEYAHRYIPKLSRDRINWTSIEQDKIRIDKNTGEATLTLKISKSPLFVAAQEITSTADTNKWIEQQLSFSAFLRLDTIGFSVQKRPLTVINSGGTSKKAIVLIARQHPPEIPGGTIAFNTFFETLMVKDELANKFRDKFNIIAFPMPNPDGVDLGYWRHNANGVDLNRDWIAFTQPETKAIKAYLESFSEQELDIKFAVDFHTSYSGPYLLTLDDQNQSQSDKTTAKWIFEIEKNSFFRVEEKKRSQNLPYGYNYFFNQFGSEAVTYEEGDEVNRGIIRERAKVYAHHLMKVLLANNSDE